MGAIGGLLGTAGGASGTGFKGPQGASILAPITQEQVQSANTASQNSLASQNALIAALQSQNGLAAQGGAQAANKHLAGQLAATGGIGNQTSALAQQQALNQQLAQAGGVGTQSNAVAGLQNVAAQQQGTANMYADIAAGRGPNPAMAALNQATGQNVANQAALMAGQRGASANVGLLARQAAQQGAATQQQAVGQAATQHAQQQIAGLQGLAGAQQSMASTQQAIGGLGTTQAQMQQAGIGAQAGQAQQQIANQMMANQALAAQANTMAGQQIAQTNAGVAAVQNQQNMGMQGLSNYNTNLVNMQGNINTANAGLAQTNMQGQQGVVGGIMQGMGVGLAAGGGYVSMAAGGDPTAPYITPNGQGPLLANPTNPAHGPLPVAAPPTPGPQSSFGQYLAGTLGTGDFLKQTPVADTTAQHSTFKSDPTKSQLFNGASALTQAALAAGGGQVQHDYRAGGDVVAKSSSEKAVKPGNSYANDKIKALLSEGEIVLPREVTMSKDPARSAADFVAKVMAKKGRIYR